MKLKQLFEAQPTKTAIIAWGRMNPPTIGHQQVINTLKSTAQKSFGDPILFLTQTQDKKKNPLSYAEKVHFAQEFFPGVTINKNSSVKTIIQALQLLQGQGYDNVGIIAGSDRVPQYQELIDKYNGKPDGKGEIPFSFKNAKVFSSGERDPDADDVSGMSASKMREFAVNNDFESFKQGVPTDNETLAKQMFNRVRLGMGLALEEGCKYGRYYCSTDKEWKCRKGPKQSRSVNEGDVVVDAGSLRKYLRNLIDDAIDKETDIKKLSRVLQMLIGKQIKSRGKRYTITAEDIMSALDEDAAGVGTITKQNTTKDVNRGTLRKMLKGYKLI